MDIRAQAAASSEVFFLAFDRSAEDSYACNRQALEHAVSDFDGGTPFF